MLINNGHETREWEIAFKQPGEPQVVVENMFDVNGNETFDPTEAIEVVVDGDFIAVEAGDEFTFTLIAD